MYAHRATNAYKAVDLNSAPKQEILCRLFDRFQADLDLAQRAIAAKNIFDKGKYIDHALRIVLELEAALDHEKAPEMCANLANLYAFVTERLYAASMKLDTKPLLEATKVMTEIGAAFREAAGKR